MSWEQELRRTVGEAGGWWNAHAHLDRAFVMEARFVAHADMDPWDIATYPLEVKQHATGVLHDGLAYSRSSLTDRMSAAIEESASHGVRRIDSFVDTTADGVDLTALECALDLKERFRGRMEFRVGAYPIFGFKDDDPRRWEIFAEGARLADYIGTLPERDARRGHIGLKEHFRRVLELANKLDCKEVQFHVDQTNLPDEQGTLTLIEAVRWLRPDPRGRAERRAPTIWAVHALSVASYDEERFRRVLDGLAETNIGVIVCPNATLSNRQDRRVMVPMHNSITRVLDFLAAGIPVRLGTDNVQDFFLPAGSLDMYQEVVTAANCLRFYNSATWAKVAAGRPLNEVDRMKVRNALTL